MSSLKEVCEQVIKLKAIADNPSHYDDKEDYWIIARNNAEKLARASLLLAKAVSFIGHECLHSHENCPTREQMQVAAKQALAKVNALFNQEGSK